MSDSVRPHRRQPIRLPRPWDSPGKNTGVSCHFLLQCMKVKSESEVAQSCPTLSDPMDCSPPGSSIHGIFQAGVLEWAVISFSKRFMLTPAKGSRAWQVFRTLLLNGGVVVVVVMGFEQSPREALVTQPLTSFFINSLLCSCCLFSYFFFNVALLSLGLIDFKSLFHLWNALP